MPTQGQRISEYLLDAKVGGGAFGEVWRARHHVWHDQLVAIKIPIDPQFVRNLQREGAAIHGLVHPNIVRAMGFDPYADPPYLTMEYVPGVSLRELISSKSLRIPDAVAIMKQVLAGLAYAHKSGLVHRDIKPENILIHERAKTDGFGAEGVVKVTDFGLGRAASKTAVAGSIMYSQSMSDDAGKEIAGTLDYMAPEQRAGADVDQRADLYACGVVLYEMLTGERPAGTDLPSDLNKSVPRHLDEAFKRSYARLEKRFGSADELARAIASPPPPPLPQNRPVGGQGVQRQPFNQAFPPPVPPAQSRGQTSCPSCRRSVEVGDQFCMHCGVQMVTTVRRCPKCGAYPDGNDRFCIFCGETLASGMNV